MLSSLNIYLGNNRKYLLMILNIVLVVFIILEVMIWNQVNGLLSAEEYQEMQEEYCKTHLDAIQCNKYG
jgi:hypothetical protein|tara:strand:- start:568 stop:774 length:207 start_codon:yes stop_codon:yes gene_type:complete